MRADEFDGLRDLLDDFDFIFERHGLHAREDFAFLRRRVMRRQMIEREDRDVTAALVALAALRITVSCTARNCR